MNRDNYYSPREAADVIMCSTTYIYYLIKIGKLPDYRIGSRHLILKSAVQALIDGNMNKGN